MLRPRPAARRRFSSGLRPPARQRRPAPAVAGAPPQPRACASLPPPPPPPTIPQILRGILRRLSAVPSPPGGIAALRSPALHPSTAVAFDASPTRRGGASAARANGRHCAPSIAFAAGSLLAPGRLRGEVLPAARFFATGGMAAPAAPGTAAGPIGAQRLRPARGRGGETRTWAWAGRGGRGPRRHGQALRPAALRGAPRATPSFCPRRRRAPAAKKRAGGPQPGGRRAPRASCALGHLAG